jgi:hypothetical protein
MADQQLVDQIDGPEDVMDKEQYPGVVIVPADHQCVDAEQGVENAGGSVVHDWGLIGEFMYFYEMNPFFRLLPLLCAVCVIVSCDSPDSRGSRRHVRSDGAAGNTESLRPDVFSNSPGKVEGCVGLYTYDSLNIAFDSLDVDKGKKILVTKASEFAFFRLRQKDIYLRYDSAKSGPVDKKTFKEVYRGNEYTVVLITHAIREEGESEWSTGTLEIIFRDKHLKIRVKGLSGC